MSRRLKQTYLCEPLRDLAQQLRFAPPDRRAEQVRRLETLHDEIAPAATYPLDYLAYRITRYRLERDDDALLVGEAVLADLRLMIDELSRTINLPPDGNEILTLDAWATELNISRKTLERWRKDGLRWRWFALDDQTPRQVGITRAAMSRYRLLRNKNIAGASAFTRIDEAQQQTLLDQARAMKDEDQSLTLNKAATKLAEASGRSVEALRLLLEKHDRDSGKPIFPNRRTPLTDKDKRTIARAARMGVSLSKLTTRYNRAKATLHRVIQEQRAAQLDAVPIKFVELATFDRPDADEVLLGHTITVEPDGAVSRVKVDDLPATIQPIYKRRTMSERQAHSLFVRMNYLKYKADMIQRKMKRSNPRVAELDAIDEALARATTLRRALIAAHLPIALSVVKRHMLGHDPSIARVITLLKVAHGVLFEAIEDFHPGRSQAFETYLRNRLLQALTSEPDEPSSRAQRRLHDDDALHALIQHAKKLGVDLQALSQ